MNITLHIEHLILDGVAIPHTQRPLLQAAVEAELARLLAENGLASGLSDGVHVPALGARAIQIAQHGEPAALGSQIAQSVYSSLSAPHQAPSAPERNTQ